MARHTITAVSCDFDMRFKDLDIDDIKCIREPALVWIKMDHRDVCKAVFEFSNSRDSLPCAS